MKIRGNFPDISPISTPHNNYLNLNFKINKNLRFQPKRILKIIALELYFDSVEIETRNLFDTL
jgi:hypothetical protein